MSHRRDDAYRLDQKSHGQSERSRYLFVRTHSARSNTSTNQLRAQPLQGESSLPALLTSRSSESFPLVRRMTPRAATTHTPPTSTITSIPTC
jgi:hypothetical protein